jgi:hypothetical protein
VKKMLAALLLLSCATVPRSPPTCTDKCFEDFQLCMLLEDPDSIFVGMRCRDFEKTCSMKCVGETVPLPITLTGAR